MTKRIKERNSKHKRLSSEILLEVLGKQGEPMATRALAEALGRGSKRGIDDTYKLLEQLEKQDKVRQIRRHRWAIPSAVQEVIGKIVGHVDGQGYVLPESGGEKIYLREHDMREVLHGDTVLVRITGRDRRKKRLGQIKDIVARGNEKIVGRFYKEQGLYFVVPQDQRIAQDVFVHAETLPNPAPENGQVVICKITRQPSKHFQPVGEISEVLGDYMAPGMEIEIAINEHQIPYEWPNDVQQEAKQFNDTVDGDQHPKRVDLRSLPLVTIDGEDARDFDDAVFCEKTTKGWRLIVAIADVSHYVTPNSALDREAWQRGNSVYFPRQVIPMLPEQLSNGLCSLNPQVDRLCFACDMQFNQQGVCVGFEFYPAVMHSHARLTYTQVAQLLDGDEQTAAIDASLHMPLRTVAELAEVLGSNRRKLGSIDLDIAEPVIIFNEQRKIETIVVRERNQAHRLIEECMLAANICAADRLEDSELAGIYRIHEQPDEEKVEEVRQFIRQFDLMLTGGDEPSPRDYAKLIGKLDDPSVTRIVHQALLRSFKQARYADQNDGHYALSFDSYTHFTSPIRRYSDLHVHRQLKRLLKNPDAQDKETTIEAALATAEQTSMTERRAEKATRAVVQWLKCEFLSHKIGETAWGVVNTVVDFGLFVELDDYFAEGLVHIASLGQDYYHFDADHRLLKGESSGLVYRTGQRVEVQIVRVDLEQRRIDFELVSSRNERKANAAKTKRNGPSHKPGKSKKSASKSKRKNKQFNKKRSNKNNGKKR